MAAAPLYDLKTLLGDLSAHVRSLRFESILEKLAYLDSVKESALNQIRNGHLPSTTSELTQITTFAQDTHSIFDYIDEARSQAERILQTLKKVEDATRNAYESTQALLSPAYKIPHEILTQIFEMFIFSDQPSDVFGKTNYALRIEHVVIDYEDYSLNHIDGATSKNYKWHITCPAMQLSWVCSRWHQVAFSTPSFWSSFALNAGELHSGSRKICDEYISRSGDALLNFAIWNYETNAVDNQLLFDTLLSHSKRWSHVFLENADLFSEINTRLGGTLAATGDITDINHLVFPNLQSFEVPYSPNNHINPFISSPQLQVYKTSAWSNKWIKGLDLSRLTTLSIGYLSKAALVPLLSQFPALKSFSLGQMIAPVEEDNSVAEFSHPTLTSLCLRSTIQFSDWRKLLLPYVESLELRCYGPVGDPSVSWGASSLLLRSRASLQALTCVNVPMWSIIHLFKDHPSVVDLTFGGHKDSSFTESLVDLLCILQGKKPVSYRPESAVTEPLGLKVQSLTIEFDKFGSEPGVTHEWINELYRYVDWKASEAQSTASSEGNPQVMAVSRLVQLNLNIKPTYCRHEVRPEVYITHHDLKQRYYKIYGPSEEEAKRLTGIKAQLACRGVAFTVLWDHKLLII